MSQSSRWDRSIGSMGIIHTRMKKRAMVAVLLAMSLSVAGLHADGADSLKPADASGSNQLYADSQMKSLGRFSVEVTGHGPDVVLIPGLACSRQVWRHTADRLRDHYTLHLLQVAGFAGEPARDNADGPLIEPLVEGIHAYITAGQLSPVIVIGHSMGGTMALRLAQQHPTDVKQVLLVDSLPFFGVLMGGPAATSDGLKASAKAMQTKLSAPMTDESRASSKSNVARMVTAQADIDRVSAWGVASDPKVTGQAIYDDILLDMRPGLAGMTTPVTLIYPFDIKTGVPLAAWDALYQGQFAPLAHKTLVRVDNSKHFVMYDQPEKFDAAVDAFLAQIK